ncbi:hypothetical protein GCM10022286_11940 [Gryllotalpicola daejeonensis]|uniref:Uncharacterized protein n=1 Tax=Gryllotalpicola daejeonensis TaxID=993087 RepID=A0ABP7ZHY4_9MICO
MSDHDAPRPPRPAYGEYATPEEQRAAIKQPAEWQLEGFEAAKAEPDASAPPPVPGAYHPGGVQHQPGPGAPPPYHWPREESRPPQQPARVGFGDRLVTFLLLGFGFYNVLSMVFNAIDGGAAMRQSADLLGGDEGQLMTSLPSWVWVAAAVAYAVVWLIALFASLRAIRAGRVAFWIPLVAGIVATLLAVALIVIALGENPELMHLFPTPGETGSPT